MDPNGPATAEPPGGERAEQLAGEPGLALDHLPVGVFRARVGADDRVQVVAATPLIADLLGAPPRADLWDAFVAAFPCSDVAALTAAFRAARNGRRPLRWEARLTRTPRWLRLFAGITVDAQGDAVVDGVLEDITAAKASDEKRDALLAAQTRRAAELERVDATRTTLLAAVVHDLRTPLTTISSSADLMLADLDLADAERRELAEHVARAAQALSHLIDNLLDVTRLEAGVLIARLGPTSVADALDCGPDLDWSSITVDLPDDLPPVRADPGLLERVLCNLLENAAHHSPPGTTVSLTARREGAGVTIRVADHGPGVDPSRYAVLFNPFERFGVTGGGGLGLGLAIARGFTEAMGGRLTPSATPGGGLTMTVELEVSDDAPADR
nr:hypothetical protein [Propionibacterium sp.]